MGVAIKAADGNVISWAQNGIPRELREGETYLYDVDTIEDAKPATQKAAESKAVLVADIKSSASAEILAMADIPKQLNMVARMLELMLPLVPSLNPDQQAELTSAMQFWEKVKSIRAKSNKDEADI